MMSRTILRPGRAAGAVLALGVLAAAGAWTSARAQVARPRAQVERADCRCVDKDGNEIKNCTCFKTPDVSAMVSRAVRVRSPRARLGITITEKLGADDASQGVRIQSVLEDGPADRAGLEEDDIITALDGKSLLRPLGEETEKGFDLEGSVAVQRLLVLLRDVEPGQEVRVDYLRNGESRSATVTAKEVDDWSVALVLPRWRSEARDMAEAMEGMRDRIRELRVEGREPLVFNVRPPDAPGGAVRIRSPNFFFGASGACPGDHSEGVTVASFSTRCVGGVALEELNPKLGEYFGTSRGVLVTDVGEDSTLGLEPGDVILEVGDREATDPDRVRRIMSSYDDGETITMRIMRQKREMSVQGTLGG